MIKQVVFLKKRADMSMEEFMSYYENQHSQLAKRMGAKPSRKLFASNSNPVCTVEEFDSPVGSDEVKPS